MKYFFWVLKERQKFLLLAPNQKDFDIGALDSAYEKYLFVDKVLDEPTLVSCIVGMTYFVKLIRENLVPKSSLLYRR